MTRTTWAMCLCAAATTTLSAAAALADRAPTDAERPSVGRSSWLSLLEGNRAAVASASPTDATPADASAGAYRPGVFFVTFYATPIYYDTPRWSAGRKLDGDAVEYSLSQWAMRYTFGFGYVFPANLQPDCFGRGWRFRMTGHYSAYQRKQDKFAEVGTTGPSTDGRGFAISDSPSIGELDYHRRDWGLAWWVETDLKGNGTTITPGFGLMYRSIHQTFDIIATWATDDPALAAIAHRPVSQEVLRTHYFGPQVSCEVVAPVADGLDWFCNTAAALTWADSRYHGQFHGAADGAVQTTRDDTVFIGLVETGVRWHITSAVSIGVSGGVEYLSGVARMDYHDLGHRRARINMDCAWNAFVRGGLLVRFN